MDKNGRRNFLRASAALALAGSPIRSALSQEKFDLLIKNAEVLDPSQNLRGRRDIGIRFGRIAALEREISAEEACNILREAPGIMLVDKREDGGYVTPVECVGEYATYVSRIREDPTVDNGLSLWVVSDNLRKGAALNAVQIAELLGRKHLQKAA